MAIKRELNFNEYLHACVLIHKTKRSKAKQMKFFDGNDNDDEDRWHCITTLLNTELHSHVALLVGTLGFASLSNIFVQADGN